MPVRKIRKNALVVTGRVARGPERDPAEFEGMLEKDFLQLLKYDRSVRDFEVQPVKVPVPKARPYVPDVLVHFNDGDGGRPRPPELTEVKPKARFEKNKEKFAARFAAAEAFAASKGWVFVKKDESHIRTPRLAVIKFLRPFFTDPYPPADLKRVMNGIEELGGRSTSMVLLEHISGSVDDRLQLTAALWKLVAIQQLLMDFDAPLTGDIPLWVAKP